MSHVFAPLKAKWEAFGWRRREVDGHDLRRPVQAIRDVPDRSGKPVAIVAHTVKGKGVSFMEDDNNWHYRVPNAEEVAERARRSWACMRNAFASEITALAADGSSASSCCRATSAIGSSTTFKEAFPTGSSTAASPRPT